MADGTAYRDVIIRIKVEADSSVDKALSGIGGRVDNAVRSIESGFTAALAKIEAAVKRLEMSAGRLGGGGGFGSDGASLGGGGGPIGGGGSMPASLGSRMSGGMGMGASMGPSVAFAHPMMQAGAQAANSLGMGQAFSAYQSQLATMISQAQTAENVSRFHTGTPFPASMYGSSHFAGLAAANPAEFYGTPRNSLPNVAGRAGAEPYNRMSGLGAYATGPGPTVPQKKPAAGGRFRLPEGVGSAAAAGALGLLSGDYSDAGKGIGSAIGGTAGAVGGFFLGGAFGSGVGAAVGSSLGGAAGGYVTAPTGPAGMSRFSRGLAYNGLIAGLSDFAYGRDGGDVLAGVDASANRVNRAQGERTFRQRQLALGEIDKATDKAITEFGSGMDVRAALSRSDGSLKGDLAANQSALGAAKTDEDRLQLRQRELEITRQISEEQARGSRTALAGLEREKDALLEMIGQRKRMTMSADSAFGYASKGDQQAAARATSKLAAGQNPTRREREAYEDLVLPYGTEKSRELLEKNGSRLGSGPLLDQIKKTIGVQRELGEMQGQHQSVRDEMSQKKDDIAASEAKAKAAADAIQPAIDALVKAIKETFENAANEVRDTKRADVNSPQASAAGRSRRGLSIA